MTSSLQRLRVSGDVEPVSQRVVFPPPGYLPEPPSSVRARNQPTHLYDPALYPSLECNTDNSMFLDVVYAAQSTADGPSEVWSKTVLFRWSNPAQQRRREFSPDFLDQFLTDFGMELQLSFSGYMGFCTTVLGLARPSEYTLSSFDKVLHRGALCYRYIQLE